MSTLPEQFSAARKTQLEAQLSYFQDFTAKAVESAQQVLHLNIDTARASLEKSTHAMSQLMLAKDPRDLFALTAQSQQGFESLMSYSRALLGIATGAQGALLRQSSAPVAAQPKAQFQQELLAPADNIVATPQPVADPARPVWPDRPRQPVAEEAPLPVEAKPVAKAVKKVVAKPAAASFPAPGATKVTVTGIKPVEASPPPAPVSGTPEVDAKAAPAKSRKKK